MRLLRSIKKRVIAGCNGFIHGPAKLAKLDIEPTDLTSLTVQSTNEMELAENWKPGWVFKPDDTPEKYRERLVDQLCFETKDGDIACNMIVDEIEESLPKQDRQHAVMHLVRYLQTYLLAPQGPGKILDIGGPSIHNIPLSKLKGWDIEILKILAIDYEKDPFPHEDESKDGILLSEVIEHFVIDPMFCLIEINRILKPGGFLILTTPNAASWFSIYQALQQKHPNRWPVYAGAGHKERNHIHSREYLVSELKVLLEAAGFDCCEATTQDYGIAPEFCPIPGYSVDNRGETIFIKAIKSGEPKMRYTKPVYLEDVAIT